MNSTLLEAHCCELKALDTEFLLFTEVAAVLNWDQEVLLPTDAVERRSEQLSLLSKLAHAKITDPRIGAVLDELTCHSDELSEKDADYARCMRRQYDVNSKLPSSLVGELTQVSGVAQAVWTQARKNNDFASFAPYLEKIIELLRQKALFLNPHEKPYNVLLDLYEPGVTMSVLDTLFVQTEKPLVQIVQNVMKKQGKKPAFLTDLYSIDLQDAFARKVMYKMGYDTNRGRLDLSVHPFTTVLGNNDVRITTRYDENMLLSGLFSVIHETGHALYEQNIDSQLANTSLCMGVSMGIHESQSRMWENMFARSKPFWTYWYPELQKCFPVQLQHVPLDEWYRGVNYISPSHIRVDADELTYTLHIMLRYEIEKALIDGSLPVKEVQEVWNEQSQKLLGIKPETDSLGVLQDVHWAAGLFGYFPSYALGNYYAAQFVETMKKDIQLDTALAGGHFNDILQWLTKNILSYGSRKFPAELIRNVSGAPLSVQPFLDYISAKYKDFA